MVDPDSPNNITQLKSSQTRLDGKSPLPATIQKLHFLWVIYPLVVRFGVICKIPLNSKELRE